MAGVASINPPLHFPVGVVFKVPDTFNGKQRGEYYFRHPFSEKLFGPYRSAVLANVALHNNNLDCE